MNAKDAIRKTLDMSDNVINAYISDLTDADLLIRPVPGMNPIAWQLGHLISSERRMVDLVQPGSSPPLPEGFEERHNREGTQSDDTTGFASLATYQELWKAQRAATRAVIDSFPEADLDRTDPKLPTFAPTFGALLNMTGLHALMHAGQFVAVRRFVNKPILI
jgi:hypothetical protein